MYLTLCIEMESIFAYNKSRRNFQAFKHLYPLSYLVNRINYGINFPDSSDCKDLVCQRISIRDKESCSILIRKNLAIIWLSPS